MTGREKGKRKTGNGLGEDYKRSRDVNDEVKQ